MADFYKCKVVEAGANNGQVMMKLTELQAGAFKDVNFIARKDDQTAMLAVALSAMSTGIPVITQLEHTPLPNETPTISLLLLSTR